MKLKDTDIKNILKDISDRIYGDGFVTPLEVETYCKFNNSLISFKRERGNIIRIVSVCPKRGLLNICTFDFKGGKGKKVVTASIIPSATLAKSMESIITMATEIIVDTNEDKKIDVV